VAAVDALTHVSSGEATAIRALAFPDVWAAHLNLWLDSHPFDLRGREYEIDILRDEADIIYVPKGAQLGLSVAFILKAAHAVIQRRKNVLYLLPLKAGSVQFVQARIDPLIDSNKSLKAEFTRTDNRVQKQTRGGVNWYIRGTNIKTELREVPVDLLIFDERDVANEDNIPLARERISGSRYQRTYELSTPTIDGHGVYAESAWYASDRRRWHVRCPHCNTPQVVSFEDNVENWLDFEAQTGLCCCQRCKKPWNDEQRADMNATGQWVADNLGADKRGYHISQLNSPTKKLSTLLGNYFEGQNDVRLLKVFYNEGLGLPFAAPGDKFTIELLDRCRQSYMLGGIPASPVYYGIDVQYESLYVVGWTVDRNEKRLWDVKLITASGDRTKWQVLEEEVLARTPNWLALIDAHPAKEEVETLGKKYGGKVWMAFLKDAPKQSETARFHNFKWGETPVVDVDKTMVMDGYIKHFIDGRVALPGDARELGEYVPQKGYNGFYNQHLQMVRVEQPDANDEMKARWVKNKNPDHWHHAGALGFAATLKEIPLVVSPEVGDLFRSAGGFIGR
jgi:hypothetical protein